MAEIKVKRIYEPASARDGRRVLVDRLWPRGIRKDQIDEWAKDLAPSDELRRDFHAGQFGFEEFRARYLIELEDKEEQMRELLDSTDGRLTLLFALKDVDQNHATILARAMGDLGG